MENKIEKLQEIFRDILENEDLVITPEFTVAQCDEWDSVAMLQIVLTTESSFKVRFSTNEVANIKSVADILRKLN